MKYSLILIVLLSFSGCHKKSNNFDIETSYPVDQNHLLEYVYQLKEVQKKKVMANVSKLKIGDTSAEVINKLGDVPSGFYFPSTKELNKPPKYLLMNYTFLHIPKNYQIESKFKYPQTDTLQSLTLEFSVKDQLQSGFYYESSEEGNVDTSKSIPLQLKPSKDE